MRTGLEARGVRLGFWPVRSSQPASQERERFDQPDGERETLPSRSAGELAGWLCISSRIRRSPAGGEGLTAPESGVTGRCTK